MAEQDFWQLVYLVALHNRGSPVLAAQAADKAVAQLAERYGKEARDEG